MQLDEVTNIRITENDGRYTLSFDIQENADSYRVRIVKLNDGNYTNYLYDLGLANPFEVVQSTDITDYVVQAGEYYVYVTALAGKDSFYGDSNESQNYGVLNKLSTLNTPSEIQFSNQSADSYLIRWVGDENADYYTIKVTDTNGISREYKAYNTTQYNINPSITLEGNYAVSIKAVVDSTSENAIEYTSSPFSEEVYLYYTYTQPHDFERYSSSDYDSFLSYVSNLVLFKAKVIVVSNLKELGGGEKLIFDEFKEKIFDHIYKAELFTNNVIDIKLHEFSKFVKSDSLNILKSNIRLVDKVYFLLKSINKDNVFNDLNNEIKSEIIDISTVFLSIYYNQSKLNYSQEKLTRADINVSNFIKEYINDEDSYWEIIHIYEYFINKKETIFKDNLIDLIVYLYLSYVYVDNEKLFKFLKNI